MKIGKYKKGKKNTYLVEIDNKEYILYDDVIVKFSLLLKKEISSSLLEKILKENKALACYYDGVEVLNKKMYTKKELRSILEKNYIGEEVDKVISKLEEQKYLDDLNYIKVYVDREVNLSLNGPLKIMDKLISLGCNKNDIIDCLDKVNDDIWLEKCKKIISKKARSNHKDSPMMLERKIKSYLKGNGYSDDVILNAFKSFQFTISESDKEKEREKIKRKLARKYAGKELEYQVDLKMKMKGF